MAAAALIACCTVLYETSSDARPDLRAGEKYISSGYRTVADKGKTAVMNADTTAVMEEEMDTSYITATVEEKTISGVMSGELKLNMEKISALPPECRSMNLAGKILFIHRSGECGSDRMNQFVGERLRGIITQSAAAAGKFSVQKEQWQRTIHLQQNSG